MRQKRNSYFSFANARKEQTRSSGFTLVELMVVLLIILIITGVALSSQGSFNKTLVLANAAYDIALTIRSAETFGLGTRAVGAAVNAGYGLHFDKGVKDSFTLFADTSPAASCSTPNCKSGDHVYTSGSDAFVQTYKLGNSITISKFCAFAAGGWDCSTGQPPTIDSLDMVFERPNPNAFMSKNGTYDPGFPVTQSCIVLISPQGGEKYLSIQESGQIIANAASCP